MESHELRIGRAGQHLAMFDLLSNGYCCCQTEEGMAYDVIVDLGVRLVRLQVKATMKPARMNGGYATPTYLFHVRRAGRHGKREYSVGEFEGFALVCMDTRKVWYYPFLGRIAKTLIFRVPGIAYKNGFGRVAPYIDQFPSSRFFAGFSGETIDGDHLTQMVTRRPKHSPEFNAVVECVNRLGPRKLDDIVASTGICKSRVRQILNRRGQFFNGVWTLKE